MQKNHNCIKVNESLYIALAGVSESIDLSIFIISHFFFLFSIDREVWGYPTLLTL